jgi:hypothetical protein
LETSTASGTEGDEAYETLAAKLERLKSGESVPVTIAASPKADFSPSCATSSSTQHQQHRLHSQRLLQLSKWKSKSNKSYAN